MPKAPAALPAARVAVIDCVRKGSATVNAIAAELGVTDNAVRLHLAALERDGLLRRRGMVRSGQAGQPAIEYEITPAGETALSSAYPQAFTALVAALGERLDARAMRAVFLDAGRRLGEHLPSAESGNLAARATSCAKLLESLGGSVTVKQGRGRATIQGAGCPLASAVRAQPATCSLVEALLARTSGLAVEQKCQHGDHPACRFEAIME